MGGADAIQVHGLVLVPLFSCECLDLADAGAASHAASYGVPRHLEKGCRPSLRASPVEVAPVRSDKAFKAGKHYRRAHLVPD